MADGTKIEWSEATWNVITGCSVIGPECKHCYAMKLAGTRLKHHPSREGLTVDTKDGPVWTGEVRLNTDWLEQPLSWKRPRRIFVVAHGDLFHEDVPEHWIDQVFAVMALCPQHTFQVLTKRAKRMADYLNEGGRATNVFNIARNSELGYRAGADRLPPMSWPLPNVWAGVSAGTQKTADERMPHLLRALAAVRWISAEPLLGPVHVGSYLSRTNMAGLSLMPGFVDSLPGVDWVVAGGESGANARPMHPDWARSLRDQCAAAGVPFLFKQHGEWANPDDIEAFGRAHNGWHEIDPDDGGVPRHEFAHGSDVYRVGKKSAGRLLDGVQHDGYPVT